VEDDHRLNRYEFLYDDKRKEAREKVDAAEAQLKTCEEAKKKLDEKAEALKELIVKLEEDEKRAAKILLDAGVAEPKKSSGLLYLDRLEMDLRSFRRRLRWSFYSV
jgi:predicted  nucleic acid-binding Zn-ribbon protein